MASMAMLAAKVQAIAFVKQELEVLAAVQIACRLQGLLAMVQSVEAAAGATLVSAPQRALGREALQECGAAPLAQGP